jgi:hypothetical protein
LRPWLWTWPSERCAITHASTAWSSARPMDHVHTRELRASTLLFRLVI